MTDRAHTNPGIGELITNDWDDGTYATLNNAALVTLGTGWRGPDWPGRAAGSADPGTRVRRLRYGNRCPFGKIFYYAERAVALRAGH